MTFVAVLPFVLHKWADKCIRSMSPELRRNTLLVDNTTTNLGVMRSHNLGRKKALEEDADWLIVVSAAIRFGPQGGRDLLAALHDHGDHRVVEAQDVFGWHLIAFSRDVLERVGEWDENFTPYGFDDLDYSWRIRLVYDIEPPLWSKVPVQVTDAGMGHSVKVGGVDAPAKPRLAYHCAKWGVTLAEDGAKSFPEYTHPFNDPARGPEWWPTPPDERSLLPAGWVAV